MTPLRPPRDVNRIAVLRALQLGDLLCAVPALRALRRAYPTAEITLIGLPWAECLTSRYPRYLDAFRRFPGFPGLPEQPYEARALREFLRDCRSAGYDLLLQMQGDGTCVNPLIQAMGGRYLAGFTSRNAWTPDGFFLEYPEGILECERHLALLRHLGLEASDAELEFPLTAADREECEGLNLGLARGEYVCVHPGSRGAWRRWPPAYFARLADRCVERGYSVIITGTQGEVDIARETAGAMRFPSRVLAGRTSLGAMGALLEGAALLVTNCTGVSHVADGLKVPSVVISMDGEPERWGPKDRSLHSVIDCAREPRLSEAMTALDDLLDAQRSQFGNEFAASIQ